MDKRSKLSLLSRECSQQQYASIPEQHTPPPHVTMTSESIISQIVQNTEMGATIDVDDTPDGGAREIPDFTRVVVTNEPPIRAETTILRATQNSKKPPFPGDFIDNRNGQACVTKIQQEMFHETEDILALTTIRNSWFERKVDNEWFSNISILQE